MNHTQEWKYTDQQRGHARERTRKAEYSGIVTLGHRQI